VLLLLLFFFSIGVISITSIGGWWENQGPHSRLHIVGGNPESWVAAVVDCNVCLLGQGGMVVVCGLYEFVSIKKVKQAAQFFCLFVCLFRAGCGICSTNGCGGWAVVHDFFFKLFGYKSLRFELFFVAIFVFLVSPK